MDFMQNFANMCKVRNLFGNVYCTMWPNKAPVNTCAWSHWSAACAGSGRSFPEARVRGWERPEHALLQELAPYLIAQHIFLKLLSEYVSFQKQAHKKTNL